MTFSHKTVNILFHIRKFLSARVVCCPKKITLLKTLKRILTQTFFKQHVSIFNLYSEVCTTERLYQHRTFGITKQEWREIWRLIYKAMTRKGL